MGMFCDCGCVRRLPKTPAEYKLALSAFEEALAGDDPDDQYRAELLAVLIWEYEEEYHPIPPPSPIEAIRFRMEQQGLIQANLVPYIGSRSRVSEVLSGKRGLSKTMIRKLHEGLGIPLEVLVQDTSEEEG